MEDFDAVYISIDGLARVNFKLRPSKEYINLKDKNENIFNNLADKMFNIIITNLKSLISIREKFKLNTNIAVWETPHFLLPFKIFNITYVIYHNIYS